MNTLLFVTLLVLGLSAILLLWKKDKRMVPMFNVLFGAVLMQWAATLFDAEGAIALHVLTGVLVVGYLLAQFLPKKRMVGVVVSTALILCAFFITGRGEMTINEGASQAETKFVVAAILLGSLVPFLVRTILDFLSKSISALTPGAWSVAMYPLLAGIAFLLASLTAPVYGPMLVGSAFLINSFFGNRKSGVTAVSVFALAAVPLLLVGESLNVSLLNTDVVAGLFIGGFSVVLLNKVWSETLSTILVVIGYALIFGVIFGFAYAGSIFEQMGGFDTFIAILIGAAIVHSIKGKSYQGVSLLAPIFALGLFVPSLLVNEELEAAEKEIITIGTDTVDENGDKQEGPAALPLTELSGNYTLVEDASMVRFELGEEGGRTKGQFKKVSGSFTISEDLSKSKVNVSMKMEDFTTFNSMRDKSLQGDDYFKTDKYPKMQFQGEGFEDKGNNLFEVNGTFSMLGASKPVTVSLQRVEVEDRTILIGSGTLNRTEFGMSPSAAEGNVVDFNFQVELDQK